MMGCDQWDGGWVRAMRATVGFPPPNVELNWETSAGIYIYTAEQLDPHTNSVFRSKPLELTSYILCCMIQHR